MEKRINKVRLLSANNSLLEWASQNGYRKEISSEKFNHPNYWEEPVSADWLCIPARSEEEAQQLCSAINASPLCPIVRAGFDNVVRINLDYLEDRVFF